MLHATHNQSARYLRTIDPNVRFCRFDWAMVSLVPLICLGVA